MWCRLQKIDNKASLVVETFAFDPFVYIPNAEFLKDCIECDDLVKANMFYVDGAFIESYSQRTFLTAEQLEDSVLYLLGVGYEQRT